jgi:ubiquinone/menaquinone biosynthesis C-methylase UbiE
MKKLKLDIGCGDSKRDEDYISIDKYTESADIKVDMWELPFEDCTVDDIWSSHALEHVPFIKVIPTLKEWFRVLKLGGKLIIQVPNMDYIAKYWLTGDNRQWAEMIIFGNQAHEGEFHKCAFSPMLLRGDLEGVGFTIKSIQLLWNHSQETIQAVAIKSKVVHKEEEVR